MGYEHDILTARKNYLVKIKGLAPSEKLTDVIEEEKLKTLAKKLDQFNGKDYKGMNAAYDGFEGYRVQYIKKITVTIAKEAKDPQAGKLKSTLVKYGNALGDILQAYQEDCEKQRQAELPPPPPPMPKPKGPAKVGSGNPIADAGAKRLLDKVSDGFRKRRQQFVDVAMEVEKYCVEQRKAILVFHETLQREVKQTLEHSRSGQQRAAAGVKIAAQGQVNKIKALANLARKKLTELEPFSKDRLLKAEEVAKNLHIDIPDTHVKELAKIPLEHLKLWQTANGHAQAAEKVVKECFELSEDGLHLQSQIVDIADGKDFGKTFLDGAQKMAERVKAMLDKATAEAEKIQKIVIPGLTKAVKVIEDKTPPDRVSAAQGYVKTNVPIVKTMMGECASAIASAHKQIEAEKGKMPAEVLIGHAGKLVQQSEALLLKLVTLNNGNIKVLAPVMADAEKLGKA